MQRVIVHTVAFTVPFEFSVPDGYQPDYGVASRVGFRDIGGTEYVFNFDHVACIRIHTIKEPNAKTSTDHS